MIEALANTTLELKETVQLQKKSKLTTVKDESKTELLKHLGALLQMRRELGNEETEEREFITSEIDEVKRSLWSLRD